MSAAHKSKTFKCSLTEVAERLLHFADIDVSLHLNEVPHKGIAEGILTGWEGERKRQCTASRFSSSKLVVESLFGNFQMTNRGSQNNQIIQEIAEFSYLQQRQSLVEYLGRVHNVVGGFNPLLGVLL